MPRKEDVLYNKNVNANEDYNEDGKNGDKDNKEKITKKDVLKLFIYFLVIIGITFCILHFLGQRTRVSGSSMEATLSDGDNLIVDKLTYRISDPERFDIVVFPYEGPGSSNSFFSKTYYIKRIIGLPGETVYIDYDGNIFINGVKLDEHYGLARISNPGIAAEPLTLGEDEYFVMGDNRNNSSDSRFANVGPIKGSHFTGRALCRIYPFDEITTLTDK